MPRLFHEAIIYKQLLAMGLQTHDVYFPQGGGAQCCIIQVEARYDGQITDALLSVLGAPFGNMKMAIAVDPDIDIYDYRDVQYALSTRVDPGRDVITIPNARAWPFDPTGRPVLEAGPETAQTRSPSVGGKWAIDATKPVPYRSAERKNYERAWPNAWGQVKLADYLD
jgi:UbiD family decarboxylase